MAIAFDSANGNLYVANTEDNTVSVVSGNTNTVIGSPIPVGETPFGIAFDSRNGNLYVSNANGPNVSVISGTSNTVIGSPIHVGAFPQGIAFDSSNGNLYVANNLGNSVSVISGQTNTVIGNPIPVGPFPYGIAFDSLNGDLYVTNRDPNTTQGFTSTVSVISGQTNTVIGNPIPVGTEPAGIAFDSLNGNLYVVNEGGSVSVISGNTNTVIGTLPVGKNPFDIAFDSLNGNLYVTNFDNMGTDNVLVISGQTNTVIGNPIRVGLGPVAIAFDSNNGDMYVVNGGDNTVSVISTIGTLTPTQSIQQLIQLKHSMHLDPTTDRTLDIRLNIALQFGDTIVGYQWTQLPTGFPVALTGDNTATPTFTAPIAPTDTILAFGLRVLDNHGAVSSNPAIVDIVVKHNPNNGPTTGGNTPGTTIIQPQQHQPLPSNLLRIPLHPNPRAPQIGSFQP